MRTPLKPLLTALSATILMVSALGFLIGLSTLFVVAFATHGLSSLGILAPHWDAEHMPTTLVIASALALPLLARLEAWYFRNAWQAESEFDGTRQGPA